MKKIAIIQARMGATRFPGKVLEDLHRKPLLKWVVDASLRIPAIDQVVVATSDMPTDQAIVDWCKQNDILFFAGDEKDVLSRFYRAGKNFEANIIVRITADCPLLDPYLAGQVLHLVSQGYADYASNILPPTWPDGLDCEAFTMEALSEAYHNAKRESDREHVTTYIRNNQHKFNIQNISSPIPDIHHHRWTVDTKEDLDFIALLIKHTQENPTTYDFLETVKKHPEMKQPVHKRNEGFDKSLLEETSTSISFTLSNELLERSLKTIPLGAQTFSKSYIQYPENNSPMFLTHGQGSRVWDVDGNEYIDLVSGLMPVVLGYNDPDVNYAIHSQLQKGISFSLSTDLEIQLAEKLCEIIPCAEKVRFGKNGTDVTSAAIRLARAYTGRDKVILCGYHGWQDWSIGTTTRNKGVPKAVSDLSVSVPYNDLNILENLLETGDYAALIMEPCNVAEPKEGYLQGAKDLCEKYGAVFVFDEIITGFRFSIGGAQNYFGVTPHLSCFGKAMGNGMPISAVVGRDDIMREMEEIFFSGTFGGETLSLAASLATIKKLETRSVTDYLWEYGNGISDSINKLISKYNLSETIKLCGYGPWKIIQFFDQQNATAFEIKTLFIQEMVIRGILINSSLNINFSHETLEKYKILKAVEETFAILLDCLENDEFGVYLRSPAIKPLFKVR
jgi:glutamate-1-semialdehyde aminotransferase/spore coat polysaccharide biosynthesis protein SpsF (cytidylyltransferase family)